MKMPPKKGERQKRKMKLLQKLARLLPLSFVRFEEIPKEPQNKDDEDVSHWYRQF